MTSCTSLIFALTTAFFRTSAAVAVGSGCTNQDSTFLYFCSDIDIEAIYLAASSETHAVFIDGLGGLGGQFLGTGGTKTWAGRHGKDPREAFRKTTASLRPYNHTVEAKQGLRELLQGRLLAEFDNVAEQPDSDDPTNTHLRFTFSRPGESTQRTLDFLAENIALPLEPLHARVAALTQGKPISTISVLGSSFMPQVNQLFVQPSLKACGALNVLASVSKDDAPGGGEFAPAKLEALGLRVVDKAAVKNVASGKRGFTLEDGMGADHAIRMTLKSLTGAADGADGDTPGKQKPLQQLKQRRQAMLAVDTE